MNFIDVLNTATTELSDYALAKKLGINRKTVSAWRNRGSIPNDDVLEELANISGLPVEKVFYAAYADKIHNPMISSLLRQSAA